MTQAEELLENIAATRTLSAGAGTAEEHIVIGRDRVIVVPEALKDLGVQFDHNIETVTIDCPRYWDEHDMSLMKVYVNYMRADGEVGSHLCTNVVAEDEIMHFDWTISGHVSEVEGHIQFLICVKKTDDEGNELNHWNSKLNEECYFSKGLEVNDVVLPKYPDIVTQLLVRMDEVEVEQQRWKNATEEDLDVWKTEMEDNMSTWKTETYKALDTRMKKAEAQVTDEAITKQINQALTTDESTQETVAEVLNQYLEDHPLAEVDIDATLTKEGAAADAKAVGDKITKVEAISNQTLGYECKNLIPYPYSHLTHNGSVINRGITFKDNGKGNISVTGTPDNTNPAMVNLVTYGRLPAGSYTISDSTGKGYVGVSMIIYSLVDGEYVNYTGEQEGLIVTGAGLVIIYTTANGGHPTSSNLYGYEKTFTIKEDAYVIVQARSMTSAFTSAVNDSCSPMLRRAEITDDTWEPYRPNVRTELDNHASDISLAQQTLGYECKNLIPYPYQETTHTEGGITWTDNGDGTVSANGTSTKSTFIAYYSDVVFPIGKYILSGCPSGGSAGGYKMYVYDYTNQIVMATDFGSGAEFEIDNTVKQIGVLLRVENGITVSDITFKPMLRRAEITDDTWEPYKPSVDERIDSVDERIDSVDADLTKHVGATSNAHTDSSIGSNKERGLRPGQSGSQSAIPGMPITTVESELDRMAEEFRSIHRSTELTLGRKFLIISDSYGTTTSGSSNFCVMLKSYLEASGCTVVVNALDGAGFATNLSNTVNAMLTNITNKSTFTDIIIALGFNDSGMLSKATSDTVINGIKSAMTNIKNNFTEINNLYVFGIGFTSLVESSNKFKQLYTVTYDELHKSHASNGCKFNLHYYPDMYRTFSGGGTAYFRDYVHPSDAGGILLALNIYGCIMSGENPKIRYSNPDRTISVSAHPAGSNAVTGVSGSIIEQYNDGMVSISGNVNWTGGSSTGLKVSSNDMILSGIFPRFGLRAVDGGSSKHKVVGYLQTNTNLGVITTPCIISFSKYSDTHNQIVVVPILLAVHEGTTIDGKGGVTIPTMTVPI